LDSKIDSLAIRSIIADPSISQNFLIFTGLLSRVLTTDIVTSNIPARHGVYYSPVCAKYPFLRKRATHMIKA
jgi:hypothetical protein